MARQPGPAGAAPGADGDTETDLLVVGGGFTGLWTALRAVEREPGRRVLLIEGDRIAEHATGRNGGFCEASLTHGEANGRQRWPDEYDALHALGMRNLDEIEQTLATYGIDCGWARGGQLTVATRAHEVEGLEPDVPGFLDAAAVRSWWPRRPTSPAGSTRTSAAMVDPARLAWGLADAAEGLGVRIAEGTRLESLKKTSAGVEATTGEAWCGRTTWRSRPTSSPVRCAAAPGGWCRSTTTCWRPSRSPTTSSPSSAGTRAIGVADSGNQFHYYRLTPDHRILWGGYDAVYHFGRSIAAEHDDRPETFEVLARNFAATFPQLEGIRFTHRWSGVIDTCTRFCAFYGLAHRGRTAYAAGFTGLGVGASRFAADVMLDLLAGEPTERTRLEMVREKPVPFPPEPLAWAGIQITTRSLARHDRTGRRNLWLRTLDRLGLGFDS